MRSLTNRQTNGAHKTCEPFKFKKIQKPQPIANQPIPRKKLPNALNPLHDKQNLNDLIQELKQENCQLAQLVKVQRTQINHYKEQEKRVLMNAQKTYEEGDLYRLKMKSFRLGQRVRSLEEEIMVIKKKCKYTCIKQLQVQNESYLERIKQLTARVKALNNCQNIEHLNKIIENEYYTSLNNSQLQQKVRDQKSQLNKNFRMIRKLNNIIHAKDREIKQLKENFEQLNKNQLKRKNMSDFVHKDELVERQKQVMTLTEGIQIMEKKLSDCENKIQTLEQQNIENINREAAKRRELLINYENLKKKYQALEENLVQATRNQLNDKILSYIDGKAFQQENIQFLLEELMKKVSPSSFSPTFLTENQPDD